MSQPLIQTYLFFSGRCDEALEFYQSALGAEIEMLMRFNESPDPVPAEMLVPGFENKVMHSSFRIGDNVLMASDGCGGESHGFSGFTMSLAVATEAEATQYFNALAEGGKITMPLGKTFWSPCYGMVEDKFGVGWMINMVAAA
jgi:PhnB protein